MFSFDVVKDNKTTCDKCRKPARENDPVVELISRTRAEGHHCIYIHVTCFQKCASKAEGQPE